MHLRGLYTVIHKYGEYSCLYGWVFLVLSYSTRKLQLLALLSRQCDDDTVLPSGLFVAAMVTVMVPGVVVMVLRDSAAMSIASRLDQSAIVDLDPHSHNVRFDAALVRAS